jgi:hypothetical protein
MTLDPVHVEGIAQLAGSLARHVDDSDHDDLARTVWEAWLDPLRDDDGRVVVSPVADRRLRSVPIDEVALVDDPFPTTHGLDAGTINPTTFKNGLVLDVAQAAMAAVPSDLDLHRSRTLVLTAHSNDRTLSLDGEWRQWDDGYSKHVTIQAPRVSRYAEGVVHALSLYLAESSHALEYADAVSDLLFLDGPLYPKELLNWQDRDAELKNLVAEAKPKSIVENYVRLVERFLDRDVALAGFVKNPASSLITQTVDGRGVDAPWADDTAMFTRLLERREDGDRRTDVLTFTSWFRSRGGTDRTLAADHDALGVDRERPAEEYEVTFFVVYDPREDLCYRVEAPYGVTRDDDVRERLTKQVLRDVATTRGPPEAVEKADSLARIGREEKAALRRKFERKLDSDTIRTYDDVRWDGEH